jgi:U1 small nuclear ribonucleoprotein
MFDDKKFHFQDPKDTPPPTRVETKEERLERRRREKAEQVTYKLEREIALWDPNKIENTTEDPFKTLFVARIVSIYHLLSSYHL